MGARARLLVTVLTLSLAGTACGGATPATSPSSSPSSSSTAAAATPPISAADAGAVVQHFVSLAGSGQAAAAAALWSSAWQTAHPVAGWAASPPVPAGASATLGQPQVRSDGTVYVPVTVSVQGPAGRRWAQAGYVVGYDGNRVVLLAGSMQAPLTPEDLQPDTEPLGHGVSGGEAVCGDFQVQWTVRPAADGDGMTSTLAITGPDGKAVPAPALPPFSFGTTPTACGDLLGDGGTELVLTTATTTAGAYRQASVYQLSASGARLLGQMASAGDPRAPRPESPDGLYPLVMATTRSIDDVGAGPILATTYWAYGGLAYEKATDKFPGVLQADLDARLARLKAGEGCKTAPPVCEAPDLLLAYYDERLLGQSAKGLAALDALLPTAADRAWLQQQADIVAYRMSIP